ncbi:hypothetical protein SNK03_000833 [Fusarium graminearum]
MSLSLSWTQGQCNNPKKPFSARDVPVKYGTATLDPSFIVWQSHLCKPNLVHVHILCTYMDPIYHVTTPAWWTSRSMLFTCETDNACQMARIIQNLPVDRLYPKLLSALDPDSTSIH